MNLSELKSTLSKQQELNFELYNSTPIPSHFHITEAGLATKHFIDCGGAVREEKFVTFQIWAADDFDHRLTPDTFLKIISKSAKLFESEDPEIEVEYQLDTIGKFGLKFENGIFILTQKNTDCLAKETCGIPQIDTTIIGVCEPETGCC